MKSWLKWTRVKFHELQPHQLPSPASGRSYVT